MRKRSSSGRDDEYGFSAGFEFPGPPACSDPGDQRGWIARGGWTVYGAWEALDVMHAQYLDLDPPDAVMQELVKLGQVPADAQRPRAGDASEHTRHTGVPRSVPRRSRPYVPELGQSQYAGKATGRAFVRVVGRRIPSCTAVPRRLGRREHPANDRPHESEARRKAGQGLQGCPPLTRFRTYAAASAGSLLYLRLDGVRVVSPSGLRVISTAMRLSLRRGRARARARGSRTTPARARR